MQEQRIEGSKIIERLVESSTSFNQKTKFSQEKFIKKKTKKYCQYIKIRQPSIRLILQIRSRDIPKMKSLNLCTSKPTPTWSARHTKANRLATSCPSISVISITRLMVDKSIKLKCGEDLAAATTQGVHMIMFIVMFEVYHKFFPLREMSMNLELNSN